MALSEACSVTGCGAGSKAITVIQKDWRLGWGERERKTPQAGPGAWGDSTCSAPALCSLQVKQNLLNVSYHIAQYTSIIADLRGEIERLKCKIYEQGGRGQARGRLERGDTRHIQGMWVCASGSPSPAAFPGCLKLLWSQAALGSNPDSSWAVLG